MTHGGWDFGAEARTKSAATIWVKTESSNFAQWVMLTDDRSFMKADDNL
jgi:hypothetical protein